MSNRGTQRRVAALHTADRWVWTSRVTSFIKSLEVWHPYQGSGANDRQSHWCSTQYRICNLDI
jgi:hypothetical protein